jgi:hypothetical protein
VIDGDRRATLAFHAVEDLRSLARRGAPEDKARAAAEELAAGKTRLASIDNHLAKIDGRLAGLEGKLAGLEGRFTVLLWVVGVNAAATITMLVKHW